MRGHNSGATLCIEPRLETVREGTSPRTAALADETVRGGAGRVRSGTKPRWDLRRGKAATCEGHCTRGDAELVGEIRPGLVWVEVFEVAAQDDLEGHEGGTR